MNGDDYMQQPKVWFITGASSGLGYEFTKAALENGDRVVGVARSIKSLNDLQEKYPESLWAIGADVTNKLAVEATVKMAADYFDRIDIVVNCAGRLILGMVEEFSEEDVRKIMDVNFYGALFVTQAVLPILRAQKSGHIIQISSIGAMITGPMSGIYSASKCALEGFSEALAQEVKDFGINVTMVEPGGYWTRLYLDMETSKSNPAYDDLKAKFADAESVDSDPKLAADAIMKLVAMKNPPLRLILGKTVYEYAKENAKSRLDEWEKNKEITFAAEKATPPPAGYGES